MRNTIRQQMQFVEPAIRHEHAEELRQIQKLISNQKEIFDLVHADLTRGLYNPAAGRRGKMTAGQVFRVLLIKQMNGFSYQILRYHLEDSRTYRAFCGFGIGDEIPSKSTIQRDIKKLRSETLEAINRILLDVAARRGIERGHKARIDCTVCESNIHHPTDSSLLYDCVRVLNRLNQTAKDLVGIKVTNHTRRAKKRALGILNAKNKKIRTSRYRDLLRVTKATVADASVVKQLLNSTSIHSINQHIIATALSAELENYIILAQKVIKQAERRVVNGETLKASEKIVSIFEPHTDIIVKDRRDIYYGHKLAITGGASGLLTDLIIEKGNPSDTTIAQKMILRQKEIYGRVPIQAALDGGFASRDNLASIKSFGVEDVVFAKKRGLKVCDMAKSLWVYKRLRDFRAGIEGMFSFLKRCFGLGRCTWSGFQSFKAYAWSSVVTANLLLMARRMLA